MCWRSPVRGNTIELLKPGIAFSVVITVIPGLLSAGKIPSLALVAATLVGTLLVAMSSFAYNQIIETRTDSMMDRTRNRPLVTGKLPLWQAHALAFVLLVFGTYLLWVQSTPLAAGIALFSFVYYLLIYTLWLKPTTVQSTVLGGVCGAIGPMIGEAAIANRVGMPGIMLFLLLFLWQPPHFWELAIARRDDYRKANFPLLPVLKGIPETLRSMIFSQWLHVVATIAVPLLGLAGWIFTVPSLFSSLVTLLLIYRMRKDASASSAMKVFFASIAHNLVWHAAFSVDAAVGILRD